MVKLVDINIELLTPMMKDYAKAKLANENALVAFRMGDFYEFFFEDAIKASQILQITLTSRGKAGEHTIPMCGIPFHAADNYFAKLIGFGERLAICDQLETPEEAKRRDGHKALVNRDITRVLTPGTLTEDNLLKGHGANYLLAIVRSADSNKFTLAWADISTGEFYLTEVDDSNLVNFLAIVEPKEIIISDRLYDDRVCRENLREYDRIMVNQVNSYFDSRRNEIIIKEFYNLHTIESISLPNDAAISAVGAVIEYIRITQKKGRVKFSYPKLLQKSGYMNIDNYTIRNLEILKSSNDNGLSLLSLLDYTATSVGFRRLVSEVKRPLIDVDSIKTRQAIVEFFYSNIDFSNQVHSTLRSFSDIERVVQRAEYGRCGPRDIYSLGLGLKTALKIAESFDLSTIATMPPEILKLCQGLGSLDILAEEIRKTISAEAPYLARDGNFILSNVHPRIDELRHMSESSDSELNLLRDKYRLMTGVSNLKISFNNVLGYFIEVTPQHGEKLLQNQEFVHRQSLANSVRFSSETLKKMEQDIVTAKDQLLRIELELFEQILAKVKDAYEHVKIIADKIGWIDFYISLGLAAALSSWIKPVVDDSTDIEIIQGVHPIVNKSLNKLSNKFVPNDLKFLGDNLIILTGPNMAGKSTYLRQNALIIILAQIGSFVPCSYARIGIVDRVFSRIGASDDLASGKSTFMVEMIETATILQQATGRSFIILDEIGRGTATYDGLSIAFAVAEYIHNEISARTIFATHYHELQDLAKTAPKVRNCFVKVKEWQGDVVFLYQITDGTADKSYGIHVAKIAGIPMQVVNRAQEILNSIENGIGNGELIS